MRRSASEIIRNLESRIARLERSATTQKEAANVLTLADRLNNATDDYVDDVRGELVLIIQADGVKQYRPRHRNSVVIGPPNQPVTMTLSGSFISGTLSINFYEDRKVIKSITTKKLFLKEPKEVALWIWKNTPSNFKTPKV